MNLIEVDHRLFSFPFAAFAAAVLLVGMFIFYFWKIFPRSEWALYIDRDGLLINTRPSFRRSTAECEAKIIHLAYRDIGSARQVDDIIKLYPGSYRWLEKSRSSCLELTIKDGASTALGNWLKRLSSDPHLSDFIIVPALIADNVLVVYWRNEDLQVFPTCARALHVLGEYGVAIKDTVVLGD